MGRQIGKQKGKRERERQRVSTQQKFYAPQIFVERDGREKGKKEGETHELRPSSMLREIS